MFFKFFNTAPKTKSNAVYKLEKAGKTSLILEAIEKERKTEGKNSGSSENGKVTVKRVGTYNS